MRYISDLGLKTHSQAQANKHGITIWSKGNYRFQRMHMTEFALFRHSLLGEREAIAGKSPR